MQGATRQFPWSFVEYNMVVQPLLDIIQGEVVSRLLADKLFTAGYLDEEFGVPRQSCFYVCLLKHFARLLKK